jgi:hypothetical protein
MMEAWVETEWRELGFYFDQREGVKERRLVGSRQGLRHFRDLLIAYASDPRNDQESEHEHYDPFGSLKIMTAASPGMDTHAIFGPLSDLKRLADIVDTHLDAATPGAQVRISEEYAPNCEYVLILDVRQDGYDPPSAEAEL